MNKLVAFIGSPNKNGKTASLVNEIVRGAEKSGASAKIYTLNNMNIKCCQACMHCKSAGEGCAIKDDMQAVYEDFKEADAIVIGSPIYMYQVSAQTKIFFDRLYALFDGSFARGYDVKKAVMVYSQGQSNPDLFKPYFNINSNLLRGLGLNIIDTIISAGPGESKKELMARAFEDGKKLVQ